jgi:hypothetical protein
MSDKITAFTWERANELIKISKWKNGGCLMKNGEIKPNFPPETKGESNFIKEVWKLLPNSSSYNSALRVCSGQKYYNDEQKEEKLFKQVAELTYKYS